MGGEGSVGRGRPRSGTDRRGLSLPAWAGAAAAVGVLTRIPWGGLIVLAIVAVLVYLGYLRFRHWAVAGGTAPVGLVPETPELPFASPRAPWDEGEAAPVTPTGGRSTAPVAFLWRPESGPRPIANYPMPKTVSQRAPAATGFGLRVVLLVFGVALALVLLHRVVFLGMDEFVRGLGGLLYWPRPWPGVLVHPTLGRTLPDFVLLMYLAMLLGICLATRVWADPRFTPRQRQNVLLLLLAYVFAEGLLDSIGFAFPERLVASAFLLARGLLGGVFVALIVFAILRLPPPTLVEARFRRDRSALVVAGLVATLSVVLSALVLVALYQLTGVGRSVVPFAVLLMLPFLSISFFGAIGRGLYALELRQHRPPSLAGYHPLVSLIMPAFNEEAHLAEAVRSADAAARLYPGVTEILVANDGSSDRTSAVARAAIGGLQHATGAVLDLPHGGKSNALNAALRSARGEVIVRIDSDSRISPQRGFGAMVGHLADPSVGGVQGMILPLQTEGWTRKLRFMEIAWNHLYLRRAQMATRTTQVVDGAFCAFRRADLLRAGGWVSWNGEDTEITLRMQRQGYRMRFEPGALAFEDVPADYNDFRKQRIRWNRGGIFAHRRHLGSLFTGPFEFGGLALAMWLVFFVRAGLRGLIWAYALLFFLIAGLPTLLDVAVITAILLVPRGLVIGYYLVRLGRWRFLPYILAWPATGSVKQYISLEAYGTMLPGSVAEFAE